MYNTDIMVIVLFVIMLIGFLLGKLKVINRQSENAISYIIVNIAMPMLIITSSELDFDATAKNEAIWMSIAAIIMYFVAIILASIFVKNPVARFATVFSNAGYMGLPVLSQLMGAKGVFLGAIFQMIFHVFTWTYGVSLFSKSGKFSDSLKKMINPSLLAVILSLTLMFTGWKIPVTVKTLLDMMGSLTTPLSMILIGAILSGVNLFEMLSKKEIYIVSLLRLLILPASVLLFLLFPGIPKVSLYVVFILNAMPSGTITGILAAKYKNDEKLASAIVAFTTLLSIGTLYLITEVLNVSALFG